MLIVIKNHQDHFIDNQINTPEYLQVLQHHIEHYLLKHSFTFSINKVL